MASAFNLSYEIKLSPKSKASYDALLAEYREMKEVDEQVRLHMMSRAADQFKKYTTIQKKVLTLSEQKQLLVIFYGSLVEKEENGFEAYPKLDDLIQTLTQLRDGTFQVDLGQKGWGCLPCFHSLQVKAQVAGGTPAVEAPAEAQ